MSSLAFAFGAALHHDHALTQDAAPLAAFLDALLAGVPELVQFSVPLGTGKGRAPTAYRRDALLANVHEGKLFSLRVETPPSTPERDIAAVGVEVAPSETVAEAGRRRGYRYTVDVTLGARVIHRLGIPTAVTSLVDLAGAVSALAGVVFSAEAANLAGALASGRSVGSLSQSQDEQVRDVYYAINELKGRVRGPEWGTFLSAEHVVRLGGIDRLRAESQCGRVVALSSGGAFLQITEEMPDPHDPSLAQQRLVLAQFLAPVR